METGITIVTPNGIVEKGKYRVAYLLHGLCGRSGDLADYTMLPAFANDYNIIFIMPEVARSFYTDMKYGLKYFSYITEELPVICKSIFNISSQREDTIIMGASMGGYGAFGPELEWSSKYEIMDLAKNINHQKIKPIIYATCGTEDYLREFNIRFKEDMRVLDFDFTFEEWEGKHDWYFSNESIRKALKKISLK